jgi:hypothetical protein
VKNTSAQRGKGKKKNATFPANPDPTANMHCDRVKKKGGHVTHVIRKEARKRGKEIKIGVIQILKIHPERWSAKLLAFIEVSRAFKRPEPGCGPWRERCRHGHGERSLHDRRAGSHRGPGCLPGHHDHDQHHRDQERSHCCRRRCRGDGAPRQGSAHYQPGGGWQRRRQRTERAHCTRRKRSSSVEKSVFGGIALEDG